MRRIFAVTGRSIHARLLGHLLAIGSVAMTACGGGDGSQTPDTQIDSQPPALTNIARATFSFKALGNANGFFCRIDQADPSTCIPPFIADLTDGDHTFEVAAAFNANVDETPATYTWHIDTLGPETSILRGPPAIDNDPTPEFAFEGSDGGNPITFVCSLDAAPATACTSPFSPAVTDGNHTFTVAAVDVAGNPDPTPATLTWNLNTITPDTAITAGPTAASITAATVTFEFSSPDTAATFECALDAATFAACTSGLQLTGLSDGDHSFAVRAVGTAGPDPSPASVSWTVDAVAPTVTITGTPANPSNDTTPQFDFSSTDATATFECQIDGVAAFAPCTSPFTSAALADGNQTFRVRATDTVGNIGGDSTFGWFLDTVLPTVVITAEPSALSNNKNPAITFTTGGAPVATECQLDGGTFAACSSPFALTNVADGSHTITVRVTDAASNSASDATSAFVIDTVAPTAVFTAEPAALSNNKNPSVAFTTAGAPTVTQCRLDAGTLVSCTSPFSFNNVGDGNHTITVRVADGAGNASTTTTGSFAIDTAAPTVTITAEPAAVSNNKNPSVSFTTTGSPTTTQCQLDVAAPVACTSPFAFSNVADGGHTITVRVTDGANNSGSDVTATFTIDTVAPTVAITAEPAALSNNKNPSVSFTTAGAPTSTQCELDAGAFVTCTSPFAFSNVADGNHTITVRVTDGATNSSTATTASFTIDTAAPTVTITVQPAALSNNKNPSVTFTTTGSPTTTQCQLDAGTLVTCTSPFAFSNVADGSHTITVRVTDGANNSGSDTTTAFVIDTVAPTVAITVEPAALSNNKNPSVSFTTAGSPSITQCQLDAGTLVTCTSPFAFSNVADGAHTITVRVADAANNASTDTTNSFTIDTVAPTVAITVEPAATSNNRNPSVAFTTAGAPTTTQCQLDAGALVTCTSPFAFSNVADGAHTITVRVADGAGNASTDTTASFTIDTVAPTVTITVQPPALSNNNDPSVTFTTAGAPTSTQCQLDAGTLVTCTSPFVFSNVADGTHTITVRVADAANNSSTDTTTSFTIDTVAPTVTITAEPAATSNNKNPTVAFTTAGSLTSIQCQLDGGTFVTCTSPHTFSNVADGNHTITVRVADGANNSSTDTTALFTIDTGAPTVTITAQPPAVSSNKNPSVSFTTTGGPTVIQCQLDAGTLAACTSPVTFSNVADGAHTITVRVADASNNSSTATTNSFTIDTSAPTVTFTSVPAALSNDNSPSVSFTTTGSPTITQCQLDAGSLVSCTSPHAFSNVADGAHTITVRVADGANNSSTTTTGSFTIDTVAPTVTITAQPPALSNNKNPSVSFTTAGTLTSIQCQLDAGTFAACTSPTTFSNVADGAHTISVRVSDGAGNSTTDTTTSFTIDTAAPTVTITAQPPALSNNKNPSVSFTTAGAPTSTQCQLDTGTLAACSSPITFTNVADGAHTITIRVADGAGNSSTATTASFTIDTQVGVVITAQPAATSNDNTPTVAFTTSGAPNSVQCQVDAGTLVSCTSPFTFGVTADGTHTITVRVSDAATNTSSATTSAFTIDSTAPIVTFDDVPPAAWPVNYFDMKFHANETATFECSLNGATFNACTSASTVTTTYNTASSFRVRAKDTLGNLSAPITTSWTSSDGLVLHYPWEQGDTSNTSLLRQNAIYSPDGSAATSRATGGWAGTALGGGLVGANRYLNTARVLTSSAQTGNYTASFWVRADNDVASGTIFSTLATNGGIRVRMQGNGLSVDVNENATTFTSTTSIPLGRWVNIALRTTGPSKGVQIFVDGNFTDFLSVPTNTGFDATQSSFMTVGSFQTMSVDDLRFYNQALSDAEICSTIARGTPNSDFICRSLSPGFEVDFENNQVVDTGFWQMGATGLQGQSFVPGKTGDALKLPFSSNWGSFPGQGVFASQLRQANGHSFSMWFQENGAFGRLLDFTTQCAVGGPPDLCGIRINYADNGLITVFVGTLGFQKTQAIQVKQGVPVSIVVTEKRSQGRTLSISVFVNGGQPTVIPVPTGDVFGIVSDFILLNSAASSQVDEYEFWTEDLSGNAEMLCENGFDGEFDLLTGTCLLTSN